jgi:hypothetical protein
MADDSADELAFRHPELVRNVIVISAPYDRAGCYPEVYDAVSTMTPDQFAGSGLPEAPCRRCPKPGRPANAH